MKICLLFLIIITAGFAENAYAQNKNSFAGRLSVGGKSISFLRQFQGYKSVEAMLMSDHNNKRFTLTTLYTESHPIVCKFKIFGGTGLHAGIRRIPVLKEIIVYKINDLVIKRMVTVHEAKFIAGADIIGGVTYSLSPKIWLGIDLKPYVDFINEDDVLIDAGIRVGVSL